MNVLFSVVLLKINLLTYLLTYFSPNWSASTAAFRRLIDDVHVHPSLGRYWTPLTGFQRSSDTRSCISRSSCGRSQRSRASSLPG